LVQIDPKTGHMDVEACHINQPKQTTE
jgi:hypothetical protein